MIILVINLDQLYLDDFYVPKDFDGGHLANIQLVE